MFLHFPGFFVLFLRYLYVFNVFTFSFTSILFLAIPVVSIKSTFSLEISQMFKSPELLLGV